MGALHCPVRLLLVPSDHAGVEDLVRAEHVVRVVDGGADLDLLEELADTHRGETVLLRGDVNAVLTALALPRARGDAEGQAAVVVEGDEDGWRRLADLSDVRTGRASRG